jgi:hypothetical protein
VVVRSEMEGAPFFVSHCCVHASNASRIAQGFVETTWERIYDLEGCAAMVAAFTKAQLGVSQNSATPGNIQSAALVGEIHSHNAEDDTFLVSWTVASLSFAFECARGVQSPHTTVACPRRVTPHPERGWHALSWLPHRGS